MKVTKRKNDETWKCVDEQNCSYASAGATVVSSRLAELFKKRQRPLTMGSTGTAQTADPNIGAKADTVSKKDYQELLKQVQVLSQQISQLIPKKKKPEAT